MKKRGSGFIMIVTGLLIFSLYYYTKTNYPDQNTTVAIVNERNITLSQLKQYSINTYGFFDEERSRDILDFMINQEILLIHADKTGITKNVLNPQFEKQERYAKDRLMLELFFDLDAEMHIAVEKKEIDDYFNTQPLFILKALNFFYSEENAEEKSRLATRELNRLNNFDEVYYTFFPTKKVMRPGFVGIINFYNPPEYLQNHMVQLSKTGFATNPIENDFGFSVYYRDVNPTFKEAYDFISKEIFNQKAEQFKEQRYSNILGNNRINLFTVDRIFNNGYISNSQEVLVTNRLTGDSLIGEELMDRLATLYNIYSLNNISYQELLDYINLFIGQKAIITLANENNLFNERKFTNQWDKELLRLRENQQFEIIDYMLEYIRENQIRSITNNEILNYYQQNSSLFRRSDHFKLQTIVLNDRTSAFRVFNEAQSNVDFTTLVLRYSNDPYVNHTRGISSFLDRNSLEKVYDILVRSNIGDIIHPIEIESGIWNIHKIIDKLQGAIRPIDDVVSQVTTKLIYEKMQDYINELIHTHRIKVRVFEEKLV